MIYQKGIGSILLLFIGVILVLGLFFIIYGFRFLNNPTSKPQVRSSPSSITSDPEGGSYNLVKTQFGLNGEQLEILSRVDSNDNRF